MQLSIGSSAAILSVRCGCKFRKHGKMRRSTIAALLLSTTFGLAPAYAQSSNDKILAHLKQQGYLEIHITRTWLGRTRIEAISESHEREIILNSRTGEILRDYSEALDEDDDDFQLLNPNSNVDEGDGNGSGDSSSGDAGDSGSGDNDSGDGDSGGGTGGGGTGGASGGGTGGASGGSGGSQAFLNFDEFNYISGGQSDDIEFV